MGMDSNWRFLVDSEILAEDRDVPMSASDWRKVWSETTREPTSIFSYMHTDQAAHIRQTATSDRIEALERDFQRELILKKHGLQTVPDSVELDMGFGLWCALLFLELVYLGPGLTASTYVVAFFLVFVVAERYPVRLERLTPQPQPPAEEATEND